MMAKRFHEHYEYLAPLYGYETRKESAVPWERVPESNRILMIAVAAKVMDDMGMPTAPPRSLIEELERENPVLRRLAHDNVVLESRMSSTIEALDSAIARGQTLVSAFIVKTMLTEDPPRRGPRRKDDE